MTERKTDKNFRMDHTTKAMLAMMNDPIKRREYKNMSIDAISTFDENKKRRAKAQDQKSGGDEE
jgi:hypothetical protein